MEGECSCQRRRVLRAECTAARTTMPCVRPTRQLAQLSLSRWLARTLALHLQPNTYTISCTPCTAVGIPRNMYLYRRGQRGWHGTRQRDRRGRHGTWHGPSFGGHGRGRYVLRGRCVPGGATWSFTLVLFPELKRGYTSEES
eukprot:5916985-Prymnesium_polylepis.1